MNKNSCEQNFLFKKKKEQSRKKTSRTIFEISTEFIDQLKNTTGKWEGFVELQRSWTDLVGSRIASMSSPSSFYNGVFTVIVKSASVNTALSFDKDAILTKMQKLHPEANIKNIIFRMG